MNFIKSIGSTLVTLTSLNAIAISAEFSESQVQKAIQNKEDFVIAFHSDSCGSCKVQKPSLEEALNEDPLKSTVGYMANFENTKDFRKNLSKPVRGPSTILIFKNGQEVARLMGETEKGKIKTTITKSLNK